jgi:hypothetical protein
MENFGGAENSAENSSTNGKNFFFAPGGRNQTSSPVVWVVDFYRHGL